MNIYTKTLIYALNLLTATGIWSAELSDKVLQEVLRNLQHDRIMHNGRDAYDFIETYSGDRRVQEALLDKLYSTPDAQTKELCMVLLCEATNFQPDKKFMEAVLNRMRHFGRPAVMNPWNGEVAGSAGAIFIVSQIDQYESLIVSEISENYASADNGLWVQYAVIRALYKTDRLKEYKRKFSKKYLHRIAANLQDDKVPYNAQQATMIFLFLGDEGAPVLREVSRRSTLQGRQAALSLLKFLNGTMDQEEFGQYLEESGINVHLSDLDKRENESVLK